MERHTIKGLSEEETGLLWDMLLKVKNEGMHPFTVISKVNDFIRARNNESVSLYDRLDPSADPNCPICRGKGRYTYNTFGGGSITHVCGCKNKSEVIP